MPALDCKFFEGETMYHVCTNDDGPLEDVLPVEEGEERTIEVTQAVTPRVAIALNFVNMCNNRMGFRGLCGVDGTHVSHEELHPAQEAVFRDALKVLHDFFRGK